MKTAYFDAGYLGKKNRFDVPRMYPFVCAVVCPHCGQILAVSWKTDSDSDAVPTEARQKINTCPVCGKKTPLKKELSVTLQSSSRTDAVKALEAQLDSSAKATFRKAVNVWIDKIPTDPDLPADNLQAQLVGKDLSLLKQYILNLLSAESAVYFLSERIISLQKTQKQNGQHINAETAKTEQARKADAQKLAADAERKRNDAIKAAKKDLTAHKKKITTLKGEISALKQALEETNWPLQVTNLPQPSKPTKLSTAVPPMPIAPVMKKPGLFNKKKIEAENAAMAAQYESQLAAYHQACAQAEAAREENRRLDKQYSDDMAAYYARLDQEAALLKEKAQQETDVRIEGIKQKIDGLTSETPQLEAKIEALMQEDYIPEEETVTAQENAISVLLDNDLRQAEKQLKNAVKIRAQLYSYNIIHSKYRNQVALSTIYEYLDTGRCDGLTGTGGAYNLYESECRSNLIIAQLTQVIETLEEIKKTQYMIYSELKQISASLDMLNHKMDQAVSELQTLHFDMEQMNHRLANISNNTETLVANTEKISETTAAIADSTSRIENNTAVAAYYSAVTAHYSKINAQLTNAVGFMLALK